MGCNQYQLLGIAENFKESILGTHFSQKSLMTPQYVSGTANHSQSPGPMLMLTEQKLLFSWWPTEETDAIYNWKEIDNADRVPWFVYIPGVLLPGTFM